MSDATRRRSSMCSLGEGLCVRRRVFSVSLTAPLLFRVRTCRHVIGIVLPQYQEVVMRLRQLSPNRRAQRVRARALVAMTAAMSLLAVRPVSSDPSDIFSIGAPAVGSPPPKASDLRVGDASVSPTGAFQYSYPIAVPPGRQNMQPALSLTYSSQAPIYGGIAAGWTLGGLHAITLDVSAGRMIYQVRPKRWTS